jgi:hypothetical protein
LFTLGYHGFALLNVAYLSGLDHALHVCLGQVLEEDRALEQFLDGLLGLRAFFDDLGLERGFDVELAIHLRADPLATYLLCAVLLHPFQLFFELLLVGLIV